MKEWFIARETWSGKLIAKTYDVSELIKWVIGYMDENGLTAVDIEIKRVTEAEIKRIK